MSKLLRVKIYDMANKIMQPLKSKTLNCVKFDQLMRRNCTEKSEQRDRKKTKQRDKETETEMCVCACVCNDCKRV